MSFGKPNSKPYELDADAIPIGVRPKAEMGEEWTIAAHLVKGRYPQKVDFATPHKGHNAVTVNCRLCFCEPCEVDCSLV